MRQDRLVLIAPYETDRDRWLAMPWINRYSGSVYHLTLEPSAGREREGLVTPKAYRDILAAYLAHEEAKSLAPDGGPCDPPTSGLLLHRPVLVRTITHVGKEANQLEDTLTGLVANQNERLNNYEDPERTYFRDQVVPHLLERYGVRGTARRLNLSVATVHAVLKNGAYPRAASRRKYAALAED